MIVDVLWMDDDVDVDDATKIIHRLVGVRLWISSRCHSKLLEAAFDVSLSGSYGHSLKLKRINCK